MDERFKAEIARLTAGIAALRTVHSLIRRGSMTIEIKGLGGKVQAAREAINSARRASTDLETAAGAFAADADEITTQIKKHHSDLLFEAQTLGNSQGEVKGSATSQGERVVITPADVVDVKAALAAPEVAKPATTFPPIDPGAAA